MNIRVVLDRKELDELEQNDRSSLVAQIARSFCELGISVESITPDGMNLNAPSMVYQEQGIYDPATMESPVLPDGIPTLHVLYITSLYVPKNPDDF